MNLSSMPQQVCLGQYAILQGQSIVLMIVENKNTRGVSDGWSAEILIIRRDCIIYDGFYNT